MLSNKVIVFFIFSILIFIPENEHYSLTGNSSCIKDLKSLIKGYERNDFIGVSYEVENGLRGSKIEDVSIWMTFFITIRKCINIPNIALTQQVFLIFVESLLTAIHCSRHGR